MEIYATGLGAALEPGALAAVIAVCAAAVVAVAIFVIMHIVSRKKAANDAHTEGEKAKEDLPPVGDGEISPAEEELPVEEKTENAEDETPSAAAEGEAVGGEPENLPSAAEESVISSEEESERPAANPPFFTPSRGFYYDRSFTARLIQSGGDTKNYYCALKAELLAYGAKSRVSWRHESFRAGKKLIAKAAYRGKTLCLLLALSPAAYDGAKYSVEDISDISRYADTPCLYRVTGSRRAKFAAELIADAASAAGLARKEPPLVEAPAYETEEALLKRGLIKIVEGKAGGEEEPAEDIRPVHSVRVSEVSVLRDEVAAAHVEYSGRYADKTKTGIINVDVISANFADGETVTLEEIKKRIGGYDKVTYIKVLARGSLDKALTVEADEFSIEAVKMILLTGGKVLRTKRGGE